MTLGNAIRQPSAFLPMAMSGAALAVVLLHLAFFGTAPEEYLGRPDEGPAAHLFQILVTGQVPLILYFLWRWLRVDVKASAAVLGVQLLAVVVAATPVYLLGL